MAFTIVQQTDTFQPIWHPMMFLMNSTQTSEDQFQYRFEISVGAVTRAFKISPRPVDGYGEFDVSSHLQDFLDGDDFELITSDNVTEAPSVTYQVDVTEEWIDSSGVSQTGVTQSFGDKYATDILLDRVQYLEYDEDTYKLMPTGGITLTGEILLNTKETDYIYKGDMMYVHVVGIPASNTIQPRVTEFDSSGTIIADTFLFGNSSVDNEPAKYFKWDTSSLTANTTSVQLRFADGTGSIVSDSKTWKVLDALCSPYTSYKFFYKDSLGSMNTITMNKVSYQNVSIKPETYRKRIDPFNDGERKRGTVRYNQKSEEVYKANTDILSYKQTYKVEDLLESTLVYLDVRNLDEWGSLEFIPVEITTTTMDRGVFGNPDLPQYTIEFRPAFEKMTRR